MPTQQAGPPAWLKELAALHLPHMRSEIKRTLIGLVRGRSRAELARAEAVSLDTIKDWIHTATQLIGSHMSFEHLNPAELRGIWTGMHVACCMAEEQAQRDRPENYPDGYPGRYPRG